MAAALRDAGHWAQICDDRWRLVYVTDDLRRTFGAGELAHFAIGEHQFSEATMVASRRFRHGPNTDELMRRYFRAVRDLVLADTPGGRHELRNLVDPMLHDLVEAATPSDSEVASLEVGGSGLFGPESMSLLALRVRDATGRLAGTAGIFKPAVGMATLAAMTADADSGHVQRMQLVARAARRPAAILFADLEGSSRLARRLSTAAYFALARRLVRAADQCVVDAGGLVGRHLGDGVVAFFLAETAGSESGAARACVQAMQRLRESVDRVALASDLCPEDVVLRFGLHWGSTLYVGNITTRGRSEVTALGDEVNETARIEACASGGRALASKDLIERLDAADAEALGIASDRMAYTVLADLDTATDKARRDAPAIAVCQL
ncbi:MAG: adenylate/guanylate cyclase domain-containing protein [Acidimicrobiales bacterium]|nr:adenylate/guanylate cyclase domain-containing protein [Acidimicrobiales bacterium]